MLEDPQAMYKDLLHSNVTKTIHREPYPAISPTRPQLSQKGKVVLITGGGTNIGYAISRSFVRAGADTVIIIGRRNDVLVAAASRLEAEGKAAGTNTKIISQSCDVVDLTQVNAFWKDLGAKGIHVDIYVANMAKFTEPKPMLELGADEIWSQFEANAKGPLYFTEKFCGQSGEKQRFIVNVSTQAVHMTAHPVVTVRPGYTLTKLAGTLFFQLIAQDIPAEKVQVISFHPGLVYNDIWKTMGMPLDFFDSDELCGGFAVWATTKEAQFLHGRFVWAAWDVEELAEGELRKRIDDDPYFLRASIVGLNGGFLV